MEDKASAAPFPLKTVSIKMSTIIEKTVQSSYNWRKTKNGKTWCLRQKTKTW
ncbi:unknown [Choristoneura occidentalis granulovirus]|uniref:Uncharacterized protein n=1 Tax=Choristoneura occidentalis granulovirus TaxID=364745 RepID=Q1A4J6_9BBAC|nr:unknown [Choristoneura fumiferana granulovirus]ABC61234.1 unknown [Choristoneura fumiferana granulovirus]